MTEDWINGINIDPLEYAKKLIIAGKQLRQKESGEYECQRLRTHFRIIALLLSKIFGRAYGTIYKINSVPFSYYVAIQGIVFNWEDIISDILSSCIMAGKGVLTQKKE